MRQPLRRIAPLILIFHRMQEPNILPCNIQILEVGEPSRPWLLAGSYLGRVWPLTWEAWLGYLLKLNACLTRSSVFSSSHLTSLLWKCGYFWKSSGHWKVSDESLFGHNQENHQRKYLPTTPFIKISTNPIFLEKGRKWLVHRQVKSKWE